MDHARPQIAATATDALPRTMHLCAECLAPFTPRQNSQLFCSPKHKDAFHDRFRIRGRQLAPLAMADRVTRNGRCGDIDIGIKARRSMQRLLARWIAEDRDAGRMAMDHYVRRLSRCHDLP